MIRAATALALVAAIAAGCGGAALPPSGAGASGAPAVAPLPAGTYSSLTFQPPVTVTVPDGWVIKADSRLYFAVQPADNDLIGIHLFRDPQAASQDPTCAAAPEPGVGTTSADLVTWITGRPGLVVTTPAMATIGGLRGVSVDIALRADWTQACPFANGVPSVPLIMSPEIDHWVVVGNERLRLFLLDLPGGGLVAVDLDAFDGAQFEDLLSRAAGIVRSMQFDTSGLEPSTVPGSVAPVSAAPSP